MDFGALACNTLRQRFVVRFAVAPLISKPTNGKNVLVSTVDKRAIRGPPSMLLEIGLWFVPLPDVPVFDAISQSRLQEKSSFTYCLATNLNLPGLPPMICAQAFGFSLQSKFQGPPTSFNQPIQQELLSLGYLSVKFLIFDPHGKSVSLTMRSYRLTAGTYPTYTSHPR